MDDGRDGERSPESDDRDRRDGRERPNEPTQPDAPAASTPIAVGDGRRKHVSVHTESNGSHDHGDVYLKHSSAAFFVSPDVSFPDEATTRYAKESLRRVEVIQHHSTCFITTATAGGGPALDALREFRDEALVRSPPGRALVAVYEATSPPIAATLSRHPEAATTRFVRWLVGRCATLARRRKRASSTARAGLTLLLVALYVFGVGCAALGHLSIRVREGSYDRNRRTFSRGEKPTPETVSTEKS